jgi:hypothetical protein
MNIDYKVISKIFNSNVLGKIANNDFCFLKDISQQYSKYFLDTSLTGIYEKIYELFDDELIEKIETNQYYYWIVNPYTKKNLYTGPKLWDKEILKFTSINIIANTYSGGPYTPTVRAVQIGAVDRAQIKGVPFGARLPWQYNFDLNFTKGFQLTRSGAKNPLNFQVFLWVNNVLNTWNVLGVFPFTGQPNDDGFLNSPQGQLLVKTQVDTQSYIDLYRLLLNSQTQNWNAPRTIRLGVRFNLN